jgi:hypothetical protein
MSFSNFNLWTCVMTDVWYHFLIQLEPEFRPPMSEIVQDLASMVRPSREPSK